MHIPRKLAVTLLAGVSVAGMAGASAASLGGFTSSQIGAEDGPVGSCDSSGVATSYTTAYVPAAQKYQVTAVTVNNVDPACNLKSASVTLREGVTELSTKSVPSINLAGGTSFTVVLDTPADAKRVDGVSVVIYG